MLKSGPNSLGQENGVQNFVTPFSAVNVPALEADVARQSILQEVQYFVSSCVEAEFQAVRGLIDNVDLYSSRLTSEEPFFEFVEGEVAGAHTIPFRELSECVLARLAQEVTDRCGAVSVAWEMRPPLTTNCDTDSYLAMLHAPFLWCVPQDRLIRRMTENVLTECALLPTEDAKTWLSKLMTVNEWSIFRGYAERLVDAANLGAKYFPQLPRFLLSIFRDQLEHAPTALDSARLSRCISGLEQLKSVHTDNPYISGSGEIAVPQTPHNIGVRASERLVYQLGESPSEQVARYVSNGSYRHRADLTPPEKQSLITTSLTFHSLLDKGTFKEIMALCGLPQEWNEASIGDKVEVLRSLQTIPQGRFEAFRRAAEKSGDLLLRSLKGVSYESDYPLRVAQLITEHPRGEEILESLANVQDTARDLGNSLACSAYQVFSPRLFGIDGLSEEWPHQVSEGVIRRSTDFLRGVTKESSDEAICAALQGLQIGLELVSQFFEPSEDVQITSIENAHAENSSYLLRSCNSNQEYRLAVFVRDQEDAERQSEEARIQFEVHLPQGHPLFSHFQNESTFIDRHGREKVRRTNSIRISIDLAQVPGNEEKVLTLDLGRNKVEGVKLKRTGDVLGNVLQAASPAGPHTVGCFERRHGNPLFDKLARHVRDRFVNKE